MVEFYDVKTWKAKENRVLFIFKTLVVNSSLSQDDLDIQLSGKHPNLQAFSYFFPIPFETFSIRKRIQNLLDIKVDLFV